MTPEQEIRAAAISAAATFCAPIGGASNGHIPAPEDVLFVADVFYGYVQGGWEEALKVCATSEKQQAMPTVRNVELRESPPMEDILLPELESPPTPPHPAETFPAATAPKAPERRDADVIPLEARGVVTKEQSSARRAVDRIKRQRAMKIFNQAQVAKVAEHKQRLIEEAEDAGLQDFVLEVEGKPLVLGSYLASL
jgi:type IV secretory pathway VirB10-like protein